MMFSLFATSGDDKMAAAISFKAAGISIRPLHAAIALTVCVGALVSAVGAGMNAGMDSALSPSPER